MRQVLIQKSSITQILAARAQSSLIAAQLELWGMMSYSIMNLQLLMLQKHRGCLKTSLGTTPSFRPTDSMTGHRSVVTLLSRNALAASLDRQAIPTR